MFLNKATGSKLSDMDDMEMVERVVHYGEQHLLDHLYERYALKIYHKCLSLAKDKEIAQDLSHDILIKIFTSLAKFQGKSAFSLWVHSITYNHCMDYLRLQKRLQYTEYDEHHFDNISEDVIERENKELEELQFSQLERYLEELHAEEKMILMMRYQDDMSVNEIAETLKIGLSAVKMRLKRGRDKLAKKIQKTLQTNEKPF
jgi:RNA polymerase sigma factor (sigma-70 family)